MLLGGGDERLQLVGAEDRERDHSGLLRFEVVDELATMRWKGLRPPPGGAVIGCRVLSVLAPAVAGWAKSVQAESDTLPLGSAGVRACRRYRRIPAA